MWPFKTHVEKLEKKAENIPSFLLGMTSKMTPLFVSALGKEQISETDKGRISVELLVFALHLTDRLIYAALGATDRKMLMNSIVLQTDMTLFMSDMPSILDIYNEKQSFYSSFEKFVPDKDEAPAGTLLWEFTKSLVSLHGNAEPLEEHLLVYSAGIDLVKMINEALKLAKLI